MKMNLDEDLQEDLVLEDKVEAGNFNDLLQLKPRVVERWDKLDMKNRNNKKKYQIFCLLKWLSYFDILFKWSTAPTLSLKYVI